MPPAIANLIEPPPPPHSVFDLLRNTLNAGEFNYSYNISVVASYVYIENAKSACSTIKSSLGAAELMEAGLGKTFAGNYLKNVHANILGTPFIKPFQLGQVLFDRMVADRDVTIFTFVKNPFSRLLSAYLDKVKRKLPESAAIFAAAGKNFVEDIDFPEFVRLLRGQMEAGRPVDKHFRPQHVQCGSGRIRLDFVGHVENFADDFRYITEHVGLPGTEIRTVNAHSTKAPTLGADFYNDAVADEVLQMFRTDFEAFGYDKDWRSLISG